MAPERWHSRSFRPSPSGASRGFLPHPRPRDHGNRRRRRRPSRHRRRRRGVGEALGRLGLPARLRDAAAPGGARAGRVAGRRGQRPRDRHRVPGLLPDGEQQPRRGEPDRVRGRPLQLRRRAVLPDLPAGRPAGGVRRRPRRRQVTARALRPARGRRRRGPRRPSTATRPRATWRGRLGRRHADRGERLRRWIAQPARLHPRRRTSPSRCRPSSGAAAPTTPTSSPTPPAACGWPGTPTPPTTSVSTCRPGSQHGRARSALPPRPPRARPSPTAPSASPSSPTPRAPGCGWCTAPRPAPAPSCGSSRGRPARRPP